MAVVELALWEAKLDKDKKDDIECARNEARVTCGADIVIKNVLPFLLLE